MAACASTVAQLHRECKKCLLDQSHNSGRRHHGPPWSSSPLLLNSERAWNGHKDGTRGQLGRLCRGIPLEEHYQLRNFPRVVSQHAGPAKPRPRVPSSSFWTAPPMVPGARETLFSCVSPGWARPRSRHWPPAIGMVPRVRFSPRTRSATAPGAPQVSSGLGPPVSLLPSASKIETTRTRKTGIFELPTLVLGGEHT